MEKVRALYDRVLLEYQQQLAVNTELQTSFENAVDLVKVELTVLKPHQLRIQNDFGTDLTPYFDTSNWESNKLLQYAGALTANYEKENTGIAFRDAIATVMNPVRNEVLRVRVDKEYLPEYADKASEAFLIEQQKFCETLMSLTNETGNAMTRCSLANITNGSTIYYASTLTMVTNGTNPLKEVLSSLEKVDGDNVLSSSQVLADYLSTQPPAIQEYYGAMSRLVHASNTEKIVAAAEEYDSRVLTSSLNLTSPMVNDAKKVYASLQMIYQILMGRTKYSALSGCFATPTEYVSELIFFGKTRRLYLEEKLAQVGVTDVSPYVDEADSNRNLLHRFHRALANSYFLEYSSNSNYSFLPDICAVTKPLKLEYHKFKINSGFDMALKDNTSSVFQEYQNDVCGQLISKTTESKTGMIMSCGIKHAAAGSIVLDVDTTTLVTTTGADPATTSATALRRIMGGVTYNQKNTVYTARSIPEEEEVVITEATSKKFYTVTIPSIIESSIGIGNAGSTGRNNETARQDSTDSDLGKTPDLPSQQKDYRFDQIILLGTRNDCDKRLFHPSDVTGRHCIRGVVPPRLKRQAVDWNDPVAMAEALIALFNGQYAYPQYDPASLPPSNFDCSQQQYAGYYADTNFDCQVFHICNQIQGLQSTFICPNMTVFSQYYMTCMWAPAVECQSSSQFYGLNANLGQAGIDIWGNPVPNQVLLPSPAQAQGK
ncbi:unnamed protein product [Cyprideis torosa]|uniref:Uncharacterized protein n=1 Tax=Cyprideis torosa TaxID=163714 RepID=A0A7R8ZHI8_9CRUS|nr:unnamed protein product [Cyprideis torosa]CAG0882609.1 unnamed protein product [Cyprideis torosa]